MRSPHFQRLISAIIVAGVLSAVVGTATAHEDHSTDEWPTTCVDLNDIVGRAPRKTPTSSASIKTRSGIRPRPPARLTIVTTSLRCLAGR